MTKPIKVTPKTSHPLPFDADDEVTPNFVESLMVAGRTAELQATLGAPIELTNAEGRAATELFNDVLTQRSLQGLEHRGVAITAAAFLREYAHNVAIDVNAVRTAITTKLLEIANCGDRKHELRALELLGKHSDVGLFTERSEITIKHKSSHDLEKEITERVQRLLHADIFDTTPIIQGLDEDVWGNEAMRVMSKIDPTDELPAWDEASAAAAAHAPEDDTDDRFDD